jgi:NTE family protein
VIFSRSWSLPPPDLSRQPGKPARKKVNLALQGGGAHSAFTWGVIEQLLDDGRLEVEGISGASAGAMNAIMLADGLARGGAEEAKKRLADFWRAASLGGNLPAGQRALLARLFSFMPIDGSPVQAWWEVMSNYFSPYDTNPLNINPLKEVVERFVDFDAVRKFESIQLFISATNVHTGRLHVFDREKITADAIMASACLPMLFQAVEIDGVPYRDGGYLGNPVIFPFFSTTETEDVIVVQINPMTRNETPRSSQEIVNRLNEITFNSSLLSEYRAIEFVGRLIDQGKLPRGKGPGQYRRINMHRIFLDREGRVYNAGSKISNDYDFFKLLRDHGRRAARRFLDEHFEQIGVTSTVDLRSEVPAVKG